MRPETDLDYPVAKRFDYLESLVEDPATKPELVDRLDASRSTVDRAIDALVDADLVERRADRYEPTVLGTHAHRQHRTYLQRLADLERAVDPLMVLSTDDPFDPVFLEGADVYTPEPHAPEQVFESDLQHVSQASTLRGVTPVVLPRFVAVLGEGVVERGLEFDLVLTADVYDSLVDNHRSSMRSMEESGQFTPLRYDSAIPYTLWVAEAADEKWAGMVTYSDNGVAGLVVNDSPEAVAWAENRYAEYAERAEPVTFLE